MLLQSMEYTPREIIVYKCTAKNFASPVTIDSVNGLLPEVGYYGGLDIWNNGGCLHDYI